MEDLNAYPGVTDTWSQFTPVPWSTEGVCQSVHDYLVDQAPPGVRSVFLAKPQPTWDDPPNFYGEGQPWGASLYIYENPTDQTDTFTGDGRPVRIDRHMVDLVGLFRSTLNDSEAGQTLQRRIMDGIKYAIRHDPSFGSRVFSAGVYKLTSAIDEPHKNEAGTYEIWFEVSFEVDVIIGPGD